MRSTFLFAPVAGSGVEGRGLSERGIVLRNVLQVEELSPNIARNGKTVTVGPYIYSERQKAFENNQLEQYRKTVDDTKKRKQPAKKQPGSPEEHQEQPMGNDREEEQQFMAPQASNSEQLLANFYAWEAQQRRSAANLKKRKLTKEEEEDVKKDMSRLLDQLRQVVVSYYRDAIELQRQDRSDAIPDAELRYNRLREPIVRELEERRAEVYGSARDPTTQQFQHQPYMQPVYRPGMSNSAPFVPPQASQEEHQERESQNLPSTGDSAPAWYYRDPSGRQQGPFSLAQLRQWSPSLPPDLGVWRDGAMTTASLTTVLSEANASATDPAAEVWKYVDPHGNVQGPFNLRTLNSWIHYFPANICVFMDGRPPVPLRSLVGAAS